MQHFISPMTLEWSGESQGYRYGSRVPPAVPIHLSFQLWSVPSPWTPGREHHLGTADALSPVSCAALGCQSQASSEAAPGTLLWAALLCWKCNQSEGGEDKGFVVPFSLNKYVCIVKSFGTPTGSALLLMSWRNLAKRLWHEKLALYRKWQLMAGEPRGW